MDRNTKWVIGVLVMWLICIVALVGYQNMFRECMTDMECELRHGPQ